MSLAFAVIFGCITVTYLSRPMVALFATVIGVYLLRRSRSIAQALIHARATHRGRSDYDRKPGRSERRMMHAHLKLALKQAELASLLPAVMIRARSIVDGR